MSGTTPAWSVCVHSPPEVFATCDISSDTEKMHQFRAQSPTTSSKQNPGLFFQFDEFFIWIFSSSKIISVKSCVFVTDCCRGEGNESDLWGVEEEDSLFSSSSLLPDEAGWDKCVYVHFIHVCFCRRGFWVRLLLCLCLAVFWFSFLHACVCTSVNVSPSVNQCVCVFKWGWKNAWIFVCSTEKDSAGGFSLDKVWRKMWRSLEGGDPSHRTISREAAPWTSHTCTHTVQYTHTHTRCLRV